MQDTPIENYKYLLLYQENDEVYKREIVQHLVKYLDIFKIKIEVKSSNFTTVDEVSPHTIFNLCTVIVLVSNNFHQSRFLQSQACKEIAKQYQYRNLEVIPVFIDQSTLIGTPFQHIAPLDSNLRSLSVLSVPELQQTLKAISLEIREQMLLKIKHLERIKNRWKETLATNTIPAFTKFILTYPNSIYTTEANNKKEALIEHKLWQKAIGFDTIEHYLEYITNSKKQEHIKKATLKIAAIEKEENLIQADAENNNDLAVILKYKLKYRTAQDINELNNKVLNILEHPSSPDINDGSPELAADLLEWKICETNTAKDIYDYYIHRNNFTLVFQKLERLSKSMSNPQMTAAMYLTIAAFLHFFIWYFSSTLLANYAVPSFVLLISFSFIASLCFNYYINAGKVYLEIQEAFKQKSRILTELKLSFITKNQIHQNALFLHIFNLEERVEELKGISFFNYAMGASGNSKQKKQIKVGDTLNYLRPKQNQLKTYT